MEWVGTMRVGDWPNSSGLFSVLVLKITHSSFFRVILILQVVSLQAAAHHPLCCISRSLLCCYGQCTLPNSTPLPILSASTCASVYSASPSCKDGQVIEYTVLEEWASWVCTYAMAIRHSYGGLQWVPPSLLLTVLEGIATWGGGM
jgi:hypothetical protein